VGVKDVLAACKDVEVSKNGDQIDWDALIAHHDKQKEANIREGSDEDDSEDEQEGGRHSRKKSSDEKLGRFDFAVTGGQDMLGVMISLF